MHFYTRYNLLISCRLQWLCMIVLIVLILSCTGQKRQKSVYYWQTTLHLDNAERNFLQKHDIDKVYCRYFDVVLNSDGQPVPNATLQFEDSFPESVEIVPVVYILNDCFKHPADNLAEQTFNRIMKMSEVNNVRNVSGVQIDCDWTLSTQQNYYAFMTVLQSLCHSHNLQLSSTVRLHQLSQTPPPADYGVLMVYNTGDVTKKSVEKPILDIKDVKPYMRYLKNYRLKLSAAYPFFSWKVLFRGDKYVGIMHSDDDLPVLPGDNIVIRQPEMEDIGQAQKAINAARKDVNDEIILYDLSDRNIRRFASGYIERIYNNNIDDKAIYE